MTEQSYLQWLAQETATSWWHDSADPQELDAALGHLASGVTTNPVLARQALQANPDYWRPLVGDIAALTLGDRAESLTRAVVCDAAAKIESQYRSTHAAQGYVCAQVSPTAAGDRQTMLDLAIRFSRWAPNIAVKLPVTLAGLDVLEECIAQGTTVTATVSFTVAQVLAVAERHRAGCRRARAAQVTPGHCFAVIMIGRLDDYLRDVACDNRAPVGEEDIRLAGLAVTKCAYAIYQERGYEAVLLIAALRGNYHMTELAGADLIMSIHPRNQAQLLAPGVPREERIEQPVDAGALARLHTMPEFVRAYQPDGMTPEEFISFGACQRTLSQFDQVGWSMLQSFTF